MKIALVGDHDDKVTAHRAIPVAIRLASESLAADFEGRWIHSTEVSPGALNDCSGIWCVPASPYADTEKVLQAIYHARTENVPFLGTCGGYQHAALEFARNALGYANADNAEITPDAEMPLISPLACKLLDVADEIHFEEGSRIGEIYGLRCASEAYHCGFGVNRDYLSIFDGSDLKFTGFDSTGDPRVLEIPSHRFFIGTAFQPERSALAGRSHPIVRSFLQAAANA